MSLESLIEAWDGETVIMRHDGPTGAWIFIAIHSTRLGHAGGGTRMTSYPDTASALRDALRLAEGMTYKFAVPGLPYGGGKAVIALPETPLDPAARKALLRRYGALVHALGGLYVTGPDVGTSAEDLDVVAETGAPYVFGRTPAAGGSGSTAPATALGVFAGIEVACRHRLGRASLAGVTVLVQGVGKVGAELIERLRAAGAAVLFGEVDEARVRHYRDEVGLEFVPADELLDTACDVFAPCALGGVLDAATVTRLRCAVVAGAANNQLATPEVADLLRERDILYAPDYVINMGGALSILGRETQGWTREQAEREVVDKVRGALEEVFTVAAEEGISTAEAAARIAARRLGEAG